jgi:hypothetical protein
MALSKEQTEFFQATLEMTKKQIVELNGQIEAELAKVKEQLMELQSARDEAEKIYASACKVLGVENDLGNRDEEDAPAE